MLFTYNNSNGGKITVNKILTGLVRPSNYGNLYNWFAVNNVKGICPVNCHVPTGAEWDILRANQAYKALNIREAGTTHWISPNSDSTNSTGFTARASGQRNSVTGAFQNINTKSAWHSSTDNGGGNVYACWVQDQVSNVAFSYGQVNKKEGLQVRFIVDDPAWVEGDTITDYDGNVYPTVKIGTQVWMAADLIVEHYNDGTSIANVTVNTTWANLTTDAMCYYNNTKSNAYIESYIPLSGDTTEFSVTATGQRIVRPKIETKPLTQQTPAVFTAFPYDTYLLSETFPSWISETLYNPSNNVILWGGGKEKTVTITNKEGEFTQCTTATLRWSSASNNLIGLLTVGSLIGTGVTIGNYVVEWHLNSVTGTIVLTTGVGPDPSIQKFHPFANEPVVGGTLYAVIRYVQINGVTYSSVKRQYGRYSPDLATCLGSINVITMNCSNGTTGGIDYSHLVSYTNTTQGSELATRTLRYDLNVDGTTNAFAFRFDGNDVADRIRFYYVSGVTETLLKDWVVGVDCPSTNFTTAPKFYRQRTLQTAFRINTAIYVLGDYIKIVVSPSYNQPLNTNTNWALYIRCFTDAIPFNCIYCDNQTNNLDLTRIAEYNLVWDVAGCYYKFNYFTQTGYTQAQRNAMDMFRYFSHSNYNHNNWAIEQFCTLARSTTANGAWGRGYGAYIESTQTFTVSKVGFDIIYQFQNATDYNLYKTWFNNNNSYINWTNWINDNTSLNYYKYILDPMHIALSLGDAYTDNNVFIFAGSTWVWNDVTYTITITLAPMIMGLPVSPPCDNTYTNVNGLCNSINNFRNSANYSKTTKVTIQYPLAFIYTNSYTFNNVTVTDNPFTLLEDGVLDGMCALGLDWYLSNGNWYFQKGWHRLDITNNSDPINNWSFYTKLNADGTPSATWTLIASRP